MKALNEMPILKGTFLKYVEEENCGELASSGCAGKWLLKWR